jgi:hypothetical protein
MKHSKRRNECRAGKSLKLTNSLACALGKMATAAFGGRHDSLNLFKVAADLNPERHG